MNLNLTVHEASSQTTTTPANLQVRVHYNETDTGKVFGPVTSQEAAEQLLAVVAARADVLNAKIEPAS